MIRERQISSVPFTAGGQAVLELQKDAVYHMIQLAVDQGSFVSVQGAMGTGPTLDENFPFSIIKDVQLKRNGSDVVWQGSGAQLAKEHFYLNNAHPQARLYTQAANVETLMIAAVRGITQIPANSQGIGICEAQFAVPNAPSATATMFFDFLIEMWLQLGEIDGNGWWGTLLDARQLSSFTLTFQFANVTDISIAGTANTSNTIAATININSLDQDNMAINNKFGTFKRSSITISNFQYASTGQQQLLNRGNYYLGIMFETLAQKAQSATVLRHENRVIQQITNRLNTNYFLRQVAFKSLQAKNTGDDNGRQTAYHGAGGTPQGWSYLNYVNASNSTNELVPTYTMDTFDILLDLFALASAENAATAGGTLPTIRVFSQEVIPGVDVGQSAPRGAMAGSIRGTSAKPYTRG